jgi:two-component system response regulator YesN
MVDDEEIIVNGLFEIFRNMKHLDLDIYKAYSGEEAIEWLSRTRIDIVLTDIKMPEIDGIQLLNEIYRNWPQCKVIVLSGYDKFDYIYNAVQYNCIRYILKTEDPDMVIKAVEDAINEIRKSNKIEGLIYQAKEQISMAKSLFQKDYLVQLLHGDNSLKVNKYHFEQLEIPLNPELPVILVMGDINNIPKNLPYWDKMEYLYSIKLIIEQKIGIYVSSVVVMDESYRFFIFVQPKELLTTISFPKDQDRYYEKTISFLEGTLEMIQTTCKESNHASVNFTLSGTPCRWEEVSCKYEYFMQLINYRVGTGIEMLITDNEYDNIINKTQGHNEMEELIDDRSFLDGFVQNKSIDWIETYLRSGDREEFFELLDQFLGPLKKVKSKNNSLVIELYFKVALSLLSYINERNLTNKLAFKIGQNKLMRIDLHDSWEEAIKYIKSLCHAIFDIQSEEKTDRTDKIIKLVQRFVVEHINEDLSLVKLAEQVYLNPSYLSRLYKQATGEKLSDFIDNERIKRAKELMEGRNIKINEIGKLVGYENAASFTRFFRKMTSYSPQEYYDLLLDQDRH